MQDFDILEGEKLLVKELPKMRDECQAIRRALYVSRSEGVSSQQYIDLLSALYKVKRASYKEFEFYNRSNKNAAHRQRIYFVSNIFIVLMDQFKKLPSKIKNQGSVLSAANDTQYAQDNAEPLIQKIGLAKAVMKLVIVFYQCHNNDFNEGGSNGFLLLNSRFMEIIAGDIKRGFLLINHDFSLSKPEFKKTLLKVVKSSIDYSILGLNDLIKAGEIMYLKPLANELENRKKRLQDNQKAAAVARTKYTNEIKNTWLTEAIKLKSCNKNLSNNAIANKLEKNNLGQAQSIRRYLAKHKI